MTVCPSRCLDFIDDKPILSDDCKVCGICESVCPANKIEISELEKLSFGRTRNEGEKFGVYRHILVARTKDSKIQKICQDGGIVTTLLAFALEKGIIEGAAISGISKKHPLKPKPVFASTRKEILECAGTRYTYSPNIIAYKEGVQRKKKNIAFIGTPCQIKGLRLMQILPLRKMKTPLKFTVGLFCNKIFSYKEFVEKKIAKDWGINPADISKINIKGKLLITTKNGKTQKFRLKDTKNCVGNCSFCQDFSAELADISVGGLGLDKWNLVILRTQKGQDIFERAEEGGFIEARPLENQKTLDLLLRMSEAKKNSSQKH